MSTKKLPFRKFWIRNISTKNSGRIIFQKMSSHTQQLIFSELILTCFRRQRYFRGQKVSFGGYFVSHFGEGPKSYFLVAFESLWSFRGLEGPGEGGSRIISLASFPLWRLFRRVKSTLDPDTFEKYRDTPPISIAILLQKYALLLAESSIYTTNLYHATPPICIAILLQKY